MARLNLAASNQTKTYEGAPALPGLPPLKELRRAVLSCLLWEDMYYESGESIADRITTLAAKVSIEDLSALAIEARTDHNLRHAPLLLLDALTKRAAEINRSPVTRRYTKLGSSLIADTIAATIQRPDELCELLAIYWRKGRHPVSAQLRKGLAKAFTKFSEYSLSKYDRDDKVKLRDVLRIARPTPKDEAQSQLWKRVITRTLQAPDTWEVELSAGKDKKETWERLLKENKLGYLALLRNLRNMDKVQVDPTLVQDAIIARQGGAERVLPFRYVAAARAAPRYEPHLDRALIASINEAPRLSGMTAVLVDVSGSMNDKLSAKSDLTRADVAATLAAIIPGDVRVFSFANQTVEVPPRKGMAGVDAILRSQPNGGTYLGAAVAHVNNLPGIDRLIVVTDEQSHDEVPAPAPKRAYMVNVAGYKPAVGYGRWTRIEGFSEQIIKFIQAIEQEAD